MLPTPQDNALFWIEAVEVAKGFSNPVPQFFSCQYSKQGPRNELPHDRAARQVKPDDLVSEKELDPSYGFPISICDPPRRCFLEPFFKVGLEIFDRS